MLCFNVTKNTAQNENLLIIKHTEIVLLKYFLITLLH
jgi:hypothetical protein